jgi:hypothetical protein
VGLLLIDLELLSRLSPGRDWLSGSQIPGWIDCFS